ncbi:hypothetical protein ACFPOB_27650 [Bosea eneae]|uniref:Uncharacterized protein n=1 Tax=Bosea eneae TaxID=151454 RepID=A0ABW0J138_9HYPH
MQAKPLSADLRELRNLFRTYVASHQRPTIDACRDLTVSLCLLAEKAEHLEQRAADADEMEAIARDLDIVASAAASPSLEQALRAQQAQIQRQLDGVGPVHVLRPGLAALAMPIGDSNVVSFPRAPRPAGRDDGGHAA